MSAPAPLPRDVLTKAILAACAELEKHGYKTGVLNGSIVVHLSDGVWRVVGGPSARPSLVKLPEVTRFDVTWVEKTL